MRIERIFNDHDYCFGQCPLSWGFQVQCFKIDPVSKMCLKNPHDNDGQLPE